MVNIRVERGSTGLPGMSIMFDVPILDLLALAERGGKLEVPSD